MIFRSVYLFILDWAYAVYWFAKSFTPGTAKQYEKRQPAGKAVTVVFIPGVYESWKFMRPLIDLVHRQGYAVRVLDTLGYNTATIEAAAVLLRSYIEEQRLKRVILIAHSKGGIIGKYFLANYNQTDIVRHMIAINSPFSGSHYARYAPVRSLRIFSPTNKTTKLLQQNIRINHGITSIYSRLDPLIPAGSRLEGAVNIEIDTIGHFRLMESAPVRQHILRVLRRLND